MREWTPPPGETLYIVDDDYGIPMGIMTYADMVDGIEEGLLPRDAADYEMLLCCFAAERISV